MVDALVKPRANDEQLLERLIALTTPVIILLVIAALAVAVIWALYSHGLEETSRAVDSMNRIRRESEVAVSARGLIHAFEEKLTNASRGFALLLWLGRTLFIVCLGLFGIAAVAAMTDGVNIFTLAVGGTSLAGALLAILTGLPEKTQHQLADVVQIQSIITGCDRQISLLETEAVTVLNRVGPDCRTEPTPEDWDQVHRALSDVRGQIDDVMTHAVELIDTYADPIQANGGAGRRPPPARGETR